MLKNKARPVLATLFAVLMVLVVAPRPALADSGTKYPKISELKGTVTIYRPNPYAGLNPGLHGYAYYETTVTSTAKAPIKTDYYTDLKSTKESVAIAYSGYRTQGKKTTYYISIIGYKPGTTKITYKYKGKTRKVTVRVVNYKNPIKSFKIGSTNFKSKFNKESYAVINLPKFAKLANKPIKITPAKGWKVKSIDVTNLGYTSKGKFVTKEKTIKNGSKIPKALDWYYEIAVVLQNTKTKGRLTFKLASDGTVFG